MSHTQQGEAEFQSWYSDFKRKNNESQRLSNAPKVESFVQPQQAAFPNANSVSASPLAPTHLSTLRSAVQRERLSHVASRMAKLQEDERQQRYALHNAEHGWRSAISQRFGVRKNGHIGEIQATQDRESQAAKAFLAEMRKNLITKLAMIMTQEREQRSTIVHSWGSWYDQLQVRFDMDKATIHLQRRAVIGWLKGREQCLRDFFAAETEFRSEIERAHRHKLETLKVGFDSETFRVGPEFLKRARVLAESNVKTFRSLLEGERHNRATLENSEEGFRRTILSNEASIRVITHQKSTTAATVNRKWVAACVVAVVKGELQERESIMRARERWVQDWNITHGSSLRRLTEKFKEQIRLAVKALDERKTTVQLELEERSSRAMIQRAWRGWIENEVEDRSLRLQAAFKQFLSNMRLHWGDLERKKGSLIKQEEEGRMNLERCVHEWAQHIVVSEKYERVMLVPEREEYNIKRRGIRDAPSAFYLQTVQLVKEEQAMRTGLQTVEEEWRSFFDRGAQDGKHKYEALGERKAWQAAISDNERSNRQLITIAETKLREQLILARTTKMHRIDQNEANRQRMVSRRPPPQGTTGDPSPPSTVPVAAPLQPKTASMFSVNSVPLAHQMQQSRENQRVIKNTAAKGRAPSSAPTRTTSRKPLGNLVSKTTSGAVASIKR